MVRRLFWALSVLLLGTSCDFLFKSLFPTNLEFIVESKDLSSVISPFPTNYSSLHMRVLTDTSSNQRFLAITVTDNANPPDQLAVLDPDSLGVVVTHKSSDIANGDFNSYMAGGSSQFFIGNVQYGSNFTGGSYLGTASNGSGVIFHDAGSAQYYGVFDANGGVTSNSNAGYSSCLTSAASLNYISQAQNQTTVTDALSLNGSVGILFTSENAGYFFSVPNGSWGGGNTYSSFFMTSIPLSSKGSSRVLSYTSDGLITISQDGNSLERYGFSGNAIDQMAIDSNSQPVVYFEPTGDYWYMIDTFQKKLYKLKKWWRS